MAHSVQSKTEPPFASMSFTEHDRREAARLLALIANMDIGVAPTDAASQREAASIDREELLARAKKHFRDRQLRKQCFSPAIFGEPAWDTLLVLYISEFFGRRLTVGRLVDWIEAPLSTAQRWIAYLEKARLVTKEGHPDDKRMAYVRLLDKGKSLLDDYFAAVAE